MNTTSTQNYAAWMDQELPAATPEQLRKLAELYGVRVATNDLDMFVTLLGGDGKLIAIYRNDSPIERYIAAIAEHRREGK